MSSDNIPEHAAFGSDSSPDLDQSPEAIEAVQMVMKKFKNLKNYKSRYDRNWLRYYKLWRGDQWASIKMPKYRQREVINLIWQTIQANMPLQTDARPRPVFIPEEPSDKPFAEVLNKVLESDWERYNWLTPMSEMILDGYLYGTGFASLKYDPNVDYGIGAAVFESEDPFYIYPDNEAREFYDERCGVVIKACPEDTESLKRDYPEWADKIKSDIKDAIGSSKASINDFKLRLNDSDLDMADMMFGDGNADAVKKTMVFYAYLKPKDTEEIEEEDEDPSGEIVIKKITKKVYPFGRVLKIANGILLEEGELPTNGCYPFIKYVNYMLPREFFGVSEVEQLESPQRTFNKILNASLEILNLMGNPIWIMDTNSGINPHKLINRTGLVVEKEPGSEVRRESGIQLNPTALNLIDRLEGWFNNIAGTQDVSRGEAPASITAASAIEQLMDAARTRIRQKQRNLDASLREFGRQYADIVLENYTKDRIFRVTNDEDSTSYFKFRVEKRLDERGREVKVGVIKEFVESDEQYAVTPEEKEFLISGRFDVKINTSSALPFAVADKEQKTFALFDRGIIDEQEVLEQMDYPNKEKILERLEQRKAEAAAAAQQGA